MTTQALLVANRCNYQKVPTLRELPNMGASWVVILTAFFSPLKQIWIDLLSNIFLFHNFFLGDRIIRWYGLMDIWTYRLFKGNNIFYLLERSKTFDAYVSNSNIFSQIAIKTTKNCRIFVCYYALNLFFIISWK